MTPEEELMDRLQNIASLTQVELSTARDLLMNIVCGSWFMELPLDAQRAVEDAINELNKATLSIRREQR